MFGPKKIMSGPLAVRKGADIDVAKAPLVHSSPRGQRSGVRGGHHSHASLESKELRAMAKAWTAGETTAATQGQWSGRTDLHNKSNARGLGEGPVANESK